MLYPNMLKHLLKFYLIIRDIAILSELCMEFGKNTVFILCVNLLIILLLSKQKNITLCDEPSFFFVKLFVSEFIFERTLKFL